MIVGLTVVKRVIAGAKIKEDFIVTQSRPFDNYSGLSGRKDAKENLTQPASILPEAFDRLSLRRGEKTVELFWQING